MKRPSKSFFVKTYNRFSPFSYNRIYIIFPQRSKGLQNSAAMLRSALDTAGFRTRFVDVENPEVLLKSRLNIFLEKINTRFLNSATHNVLVPNPEWDYHETEFLRNHIELIIAKTRDCQRIFSEFMPRVAYSSFTSPDIGAAPMPQSSHVHFAGKSKQKGTESVINTWNTYPDLPPLHLYSYMRSYNDLITTTNIFYHPEYVSDEEFRRLQRKFLFHICPSEYEGFGHQINEAKSAGTIVLTTDAPPMNELISTACGFLVAAKAAGTMRKATLFRVSGSDLRARLEEAQSLAPADLNLMRTQARDSYLANDIFFRNRIREIVDQFH